MKGEEGTKMRNYGTDPNGVKIKGLSDAGFLCKACKNLVGKTVTGTCPLIHSLLKCAGESRYFPNGHNEVNLGQLASVKPPQTRLILTPFMTLDPNSQFERGNVVLVRSSTTS